MQAYGIANAIRAWAVDFRPELIWVTPWMECMCVAMHLERMLGLPVHMTVHDSFEMNRAFRRHSYLYGFYKKDTASLLKKVVTMDAVSSELIEYVTSGFETSLAGSMVFLPSTDNLRPAKARKQPGWENEVRRIGVCGNPRVKQGQWNEFVAILSKLPFVFEIHAFGNVEIMKGMQYPPNVSLVTAGYAQDELSIINYLDDHEVSVCYLGLYRDENEAFFARTSLSSKMTTYAAAGCPVCIDGPEGSVAWRLTAEYDAGVAVNPGHDGAKDLVELLSNRETWRRKSEGARRLCETEMNVAANTRRLMDLIVLSTRAAGDMKGRGI